MRLGIVTDIHNDAKNLELALQQMQLHSIDQVITLGDTIDPFVPDQDAPRVAELLMQANAIGVWGNHDVAFCQDLTPKTLARYPSIVCEFLTKMQAEIVIDGFTFRHREPLIDATNALDLWSFPEEPGMPILSQQSLAKFPEGRFLMGHNHHWFAANQNGPVAWIGDEPLTLAPTSGWFVVLRAVFQGSCAIFDTTTHVLTPINWHVEEEE
jgi:hypothetical protein